MNYKKFVPCIYLYKENAITSLSDGTIADSDPVNLAVYYSNCGADEIIVYDRSEGDTDYEKALGAYIHVSFYQAVDGEKYYQGFLQSFNEEQLVLKVRMKTREKELTLDRKNIAHARLAVQF